MFTPAEKVAAAIKRMENGATKIDLSSNSIGDEGAKALAAALKTNGSLTSLDLGGNSIGDEGAKALAAALKTNGSLTSLYLGNNSISPESAKVLAAALKTNGSLQTLFLGGNSIGDEGAKALAAALKTNGSVTYLGLWGNTIGDEGAKELAAALKTNRSLTSLDLGNNSIGPESAKELAAALKTNGSLTSLDLWANTIGDEGAKELAAALKTNGSLQKLSLLGNSIGPEGAKELAAALKTNGSLQKLGLRSNSIGDEGAKELAAALKTNGSLTFLDLDNSSINDEDVLSEINAALARNKANPPQRNDAKWLHAVRDAITHGDEHAWGRAKLMVVGRGAAGKTSTVRSLLGQSPVGEHVSTEVADIHRTNALDWAPLDSDHGEFDAQVRHAAARRVQPEPEPARQSLPRRISAAARASLRRLSRASSASLAAGAASVEPQKAPLLAPEDVAKAFAMRPEDQALFRQAGPAKARDVSFTIWDYGGQRVFYALHHIFLTDKGVYLVVFDMREIVGKERFQGKLSEEEYDNLASQDEAIEYLRFWLNSIKLHAPGAPVLLVGTFKDQVHQLREVNRVLRERLAAGLFKSLVKPEWGHLFFAVDNSSTDPARATELRSVIAATAAEQRYVREKIPLAWLKLHEDLLQSGAPYMLYEQVVEMAAAYERLRRDVDEMLRYFHGLGVVVHLRGSLVLERVVVIDPQWLLDKLALVIADDLHAQTLFASRQLEADGLMPAYERMRKDAIVSRSLLEWLWTGEDVVDYLVEFMDANMLLCPWRFDQEVTEDEFLVSGLLSDSIQCVDTAQFMPGLTCELDFSAFFLPDGVFHRLVAQCAAYATRPEVMGDDEPIPPELDPSQALMCFGVDDFLISVEGDVVRICIAQEAERPATVIKLLVSMFREQQDTIFRGLPWTLYLVSPASGIAVSYAKIEEARKAGKFQAKILGQHRKRAQVSEFDRFFEEQVGPLDTDEDGPDITPISVPPLGRGEKTHVFLSHVQSSGGDLADNLRLKLANRGLKVWFDQTYRDELNQKAMLDGVRRAHAYVLVLTKGVFASAAVNTELKCAIDAGRPIVIVHEADTHRESYAPFGDYIASTPSFCTGLFHEEESLPVRRKWYEEESFLHELVRRCFAES